MDLAFLKKLRLLARKIIEDPLSKEEDSEEDPEEDPGETKDGTPEEKRKKIEVDKGEELNDKVDWDKVRPVVVYEFYESLSV